MTNAFDFDACPEVRTAPHWRKAQLKVDGEWHDVMVCRHPNPTGRFVVDMNDMLSFASGATLRVPSPESTKAWEVAHRFSSHEEAADYLDGCLVSSGFGGVIRQVEAD